MIVFRCLFCHIGNFPVEVLRCPQCGAERFVAEYIAQSELEHPLPFGEAQKLHFSNEHTKSKNEMLSSEASLNEQDESTEQGFALFYEDYTCESYITNVEFTSSEDTDPSNFCGSFIRFEQEEHSQKFSQEPIGNKRIWTETESTLVYDPSLNILGNHSCKPPNFDSLPESLCTQSIESQDPINFLLRQPCNEGKIQFKKMVRQHKNSESSQIENNDCKINFSVSPYFEPQTSMLQSYPDITNTGRSVIQEKCTNPPPYLLSEMGNSPNRNIQSEDSGSNNNVVQQEAHSFNHQRSMRRCENHFALPVECSSSKLFRCRKCPKYFKLKSVFDAHVQSNCDPKPFYCDECPKKFDRIYKLKSHQVVHTGEKPFKCEQCAFSTSQKGNLIRHINRRHKNNLVCWKSS